MNKATFSVLDYIMAKVVVLDLILMYSLMSLCQTAPPQYNVQDTSSVSVPVPGIQELRTVDDFHLVNNSISNGSKIITNVSNDVSQIAKSGTHDVVINVDTPDQNVQNKEVSVPFVKDTSQSDAKSNVMTLTDDVITDALFTNIDTLQDHLEVCEEGLRQQLRLYSHGKLLEVAEAEDDDDNNPTDKDEEEINRKDRNKNSERRKGNEDNIDDGYEDNDDGDGEDESDNDDTDNEFHDPSRMTPQSKMEEQVRQRRSASMHGGQPLLKADALAQKVVQRLSSRLEYLRSSIFQCHLLYKQFGLL